MVTLELIEENIPKFHLRPFDLTFPGKVGCPKGIMLHFWPTKVSM